MSPEVEARVVAVRREHVVGERALTFTSSSAMAYNIARPHTSVERWLACHETGA
jgi:hypothetical protein